MWRFAILVVIAALLCLAYLLGRSGEMSMVKLYVIGASLIVIFGFLAVGQQRSVRAKWPVWAFESLYGASEIPAFLTDHQGNVLAMNALWQRQWPLNKAHETAADQLSHLTNDGVALAYRMARQIGTSGQTEEYLPACAAADRPARRLRVKRTAQGALIWLIEQMSPPLAALTELGFCCQARLTADGRLIEITPAHTDLSPQDRKMLADLCAAERPDRSVARMATLSGDRPINIHLGPQNADGVRPILLAKAAPSGSLEPMEAALLDDLPIAVATLDFDGRLLTVNEAALGLLGPQAAPGVPLGALIEGLGRPIAERLAEAVAGNSSGRADLARGRDDNKDMYLRIAFRRIDRGKTGAVVAVLTDATEMESRERQFIQSQKMQAVGQLAGGVAHDFNNLLTAIMGHCDLIALRQSPSDPDYEDLMQVRQNTIRAAGLVRQLLAFSRQQKLNPEITNLRDTLSELSHLLNRLISEKISLTVECEEDLWPVWLDPQQFDQVIVNLVVNARDAMQDGGRIMIACANRTITQEWRRDRAVVPVGDYVAITFTDQGIGMTEITRSKVFEPFFTTKKVGEGTGLGLSTAYGIVKQTGGYIFIDSRPNVGTTFNILIPRLKEAQMAASATARGRTDSEAPEATDLTGAGHILLVEDEAPVRAFASRALRLRGYDVIEAEHAEAALTILATTTHQIDLIVSDVIMPGLDGPTWVREARKSRPDLGVIFTSGYSEDMFRSGLTGFDDCGFLAKPFSLDGLTAAVKTQLRQQPGQTRPMIGA